jgi:hypothetical protein
MRKTNKQAKKKKKKDLKDDVTMMIWFLSRELLVFVNGGLVRVVITGIKYFVHVENLNT